MDIQNNHSSLRDIFSSRYRQNILPSPSVANNIEKNSSDGIVNDRMPKDVFSPSEEYAHIVAIKDQVRGGLKDLNSFVSMAQVLKNENIINNNDMIAVDFLAKESPKLSFDEFNKIIRNDRLSMEMKGLISRLVQKLEMIDYVAQGSMAA